MMEKSVMVSAELKTENNQLKSDNEELKAQLLQKDQKMLQLENEISSRDSTGSCPKKGKEPIIGTVGVHFYVQRKSNLGSVTSGAIPFEFAPVNEGNAFDLSSGIFTAPVNGFYHFQFSALKYDPVEYDPTYLKIALEVNGDIIDFSQNDPISLVEYDSYDYQYLLGTYKSVSMSIPLRLKPGDEVNLVNIGGGGELADNASNHYTHFTGWLVEEMSKFDLIYFPCLLHYT